MKKKTTILGFNKRLAKIRRAKGITQQELADKMGVSQRVISYYEKETDYPPTHLLLPMAKTLKVSIDELLGLKEFQLSPSNHTSLWRRLRKAEFLSRTDQKAVIHHIEALLGKYKSK